MSRSISQIYAEALATRNNYLQITELDSGRTSSKMSIINLLTYVMAALIYTYETVLDYFEVNIAQLLATRINGTPEYYVAISKLFQFNSNTGTGDQLIFDEETLKLRYANVNADNRIISQAAYDNYDPSDSTEGIYLKVCCDNTSQEEVSMGTLYTPLTNAQLTAFRSYINSIKFLGAKIYPISVPGDILTIESCEVIYNDLYITEDQAFDNVRKALIDYLGNLAYNGYVYYQAIIDAIQNAEYIVSVSAGAVIKILQYDPATNSYAGEATALSNRAKAAAGYVKWIDQAGSSTIIHAADSEETGISFKPNSEP